MIPVTALSIILFHFGRVAQAFGYEVAAIVIYVVWVSFGDDFDLEGGE